MKLTCCFGVEGRAAPGVFPLLVDGLGVFPLLVDGLGVFPLLADRGAVLGVSVASFSVAYFLYRISAHCLQIAGEKKSLHPADFEHVNTLIH